MNVHFARSGRSPWFLFFLGLLLLPQDVWARIGDHTQDVVNEPSDVDLQFIQRQIDQAKRALVRLRTLPEPVAADKRQELDLRVTRAEAALKRYEAVAKRGKPRKRAQGFF